MDDDYSFGNMFAFSQSDELPEPLFDQSPLISFENPSTLQQQDPNHARPEEESSWGTRRTATATNGRRQRRLLQPISKHTVGTNPNPSEYHSKQKQKMFHKELERKRRQEMTGHHATLRSLLPLEYIKGKRSISDHIQEGANYIKHMETNIKELSIKRDKLVIRKMSNSSSSSAAAAIINVSAAESANTCLANRVAVNSCWGVVEILISSDMREQAFPLSRVLQVMAEEGFEVVNCISTQVNRKLLHTITSEVISEKICIDPSVLQQKLTEVTGVH